MKKYQKIRKALEMFSIQLGLDTKSARQMLARSLTAPAWREELESELIDLIEDADAPWMELIMNEQYELEEADSADEARAIVLETLWSEVFKSPPPSKS